MTFPHILGEFLLAWLFADLVTGIFHWWEDRLGNPDMPVLGKWLIVPNRLHHSEPALFLQGSLLDRNLAALVTASIIAAAAIALGGSPLFWIVAAIGGGLANEVHALTHRRPVPQLLAALQDMGVLQSPRQHAGHHMPPSDRCYCVLTDWLNPVLDRLKVWHRLERVLTRLGVEVTA